MLKLGVGGWLVGSGAVAAGLRWPGTGGLVWWAVVETVSGVLV